MSADDGYCHCPEPLTDDIAGVESEADPDFCWRCRRPIMTDDERVRNEADE